MNATKRIRRHTRAECPRNDRIAHKSQNARHHRQAADFAKAPSILSCFFSVETPPLGRQDQTL
nr:hypothetical protein [Neisseria meningitidis]